MKTAGLLIKVLSVYLLVHGVITCNFMILINRISNERKHGKSRCTKFLLSHSENHSNCVLIKMSRSPCAVEEILIICHMSWPLIATIVDCISRVQSFRHRLGYHIV